MTFVTIRGNKFSIILQDTQKQPLKDKTKKATTTESQLLNSIFQTAVDSIIVINKMGIIEMVNPAITSLFGHSESELIGQNVSLLMSSPHREKHDQYLQTYQETGEKNIIGIGREVNGKHKNGNLIPIGLAVNEISTSEGAKYVGIIHDLTTRKRIESELKNLNQSLEKEVEKRTQELSRTVNKLLSPNNKLKSVEFDLRKALEKEQHLNELKSRFVSMASHEFRTPLSTILSSAALISRFRESEHQPKREKHVKRIKSSVSNLTGILNDFLSISKLEEGKIGVTTEQFCFDTLLQEAKEEIQGLLKKGQKIIYTPSPKKSTIVLDRRLLKNILFNLLSNAIKYSPANTTINCMSVFEKQTFIFSVQDEGIGIPKEEQEYMFSRFFRASNATNIQGTGLGLNIVKKYLELVNGTIELQSEEGKGATFTIKIPINEKDLDHRRQP